MFRAIESNGGTNYLFDETTASNQVAQSQALYVGDVRSDLQITWSAQTNWGERFIWCGVKRGRANPRLQILDGSQNVIAEAPAVIELKDIKEMYERWTIGDNGAIAPTNIARLAVEDLPVGVPAFQYEPPSVTNTPYILHVHGSNMERWEKDRFGEAMFKRLYWQRYEGRSGSFRWPTAGGLRLCSTH